MMEAPPIDAATDLVRDLLLVSACGDSREIVEATLPHATPWLRGARSCVDGGRELLVSVSAPGGRRLGLYAREPEPERDGTARSRWAWWKGSAGDGGQSGWRNLYSGEASGTWADVETATAGNDEDALGALRRWHAVLGPNGRIYSLSGTAGGPVWVAWQLDSRVPVHRALGALDVHGDAGLAVIATLLGGGPGGPGPWSFALAVGGDTWRLGTSRWARSREDHPKRRRLVDAVDRLGGDGRFAEAAYKLVRDCAPGAAGTRVGRAVEVELPIAGAAPRPLEAEFFFTAPTRTSQRAGGQP